MLFFELFGDVSRTRAGNLDPRFGEQCTRCDYVGYIDGGVDRISDNLFDSVGSRDVVGDSGSGRQLRSVFNWLPYKCQQLLTEKISKSLPPRHREVGRKYYSGNERRASAK